MTSPQRVSLGSFTSECVSMSFNAGLPTASYDIESSIYPRIHKDILVWPLVCLANPGHIWSILTAFLL